MSNPFTFSDGQSVVAIPLASGAVRLEVTTYTIKDGRRSHALSETLETLTVEPPVFEDDITFIEQVRKAKRELIEKWKLKREMYEEARSVADAVNGEGEP